MDGPRFRSASALLITRQGGNAVNTLSWGHLTTRPASTEVLDGMVIASLAVFGVMFVAVSAMVLWPRAWGLRGRLGRERYGRWLSAGLWLASLGLIFLIIRLLRIDPLTFARPIWLVVILAGIAGWIGWLMAMLASTPVPVNERSAPVYRRPKKGGSYR